MALKYEINFRMILTKIIDNFRGGYKKIRATEVKIQFSIPTEMATAVNGFSGSLLFVYSIVSNSFCR